jgi:hypothetical protein
MRITANDIVKLAIVLKSTVSRVLNNYPNIKESTRQEVLKQLKSLTLKLILDAHSKGCGKFALTFINFQKRSEKTISLKE